MQGPGKAYALRGMTLIEEQIRDLLQVKSNAVTEDQTLHDDGNK